MNWTVLLFATGAGGCTGLVFGLSPVLLARSTSSHIILGLRSGSRTISGRIQHWIVAIEISLTIVLLVTGGLLTRSLINMLKVDPGFEDGISGIDLAQKMEKQAKKFGVEVLSGAIEKIQLETQPKKLIAGGSELTTKTGIIATGSDLFDVTALPDLGYGKYPGVYTAFEFERLFASTVPHRES